MTEPSSKNAPSLKESLINRVLRGRIRGKAITTEFQTEELPLSIAFAIASAKETTIIFIVLWLLYKEQWIHSSSFLFLALIFSCSWLLWKALQTAFLSWLRLEKLHRVIQEERWEIEHHRKQEKKELETIYAAKGFSGKLLDEVVRVLMSDDNRLLQIMLEEEMGLALGSYEHPLRQALGSAFGICIAASLLAFGFWIHSSLGIFSMAALIFFLGSLISSKYEKQSLSFSLIWSGSILLFIGIITILIASFFNLNS